MGNSFANYCNLGFFSKYYYNRNDQLYIDDSLKGALKNRNTKNILDPISILELVNKNYMFADRTIVKDIYKTPFMAKPNSDNTDWHRNIINVHSNNIKSEEEIASYLFQLLEEELIQFCYGKTDIGILLSGGMDSRIIAGVLHSLIKTNQLRANIFAITWGIENSRDVVYAKKIAKDFGWEWIHLNLSADNLRENIEITSKLGSEFSPIHLHAMPRVRELSGIDCIIAGSYGDSIGRGSYSGTHISQQKPIDNHLINKFNIFKKDVFEKNIKEAHKDILNYHKLYPQTSRIAKYELDLQQHYMRRQLNSCMKFMDEKIPIYQAFTSPRIYEYMWSIDVSCRNDKVYGHLMEMLDEHLIQVPWSKTGSLYLESNQKSDGYSKEHNMYGKWIRNELHSLVEENVLSSEIDKLNIFNMEILEKTLKLNKEKSKINRHSRLDEILIWLAALRGTIKRYDLICEDSSMRKADLKSRVRTSLEVQAYIKYRNIKNRNE